jgi:cation diffusion facilitator family transporter
MDEQKQQLSVARISIQGSIVLFLISAIVGITVDSITLILDASASLVILVSGFLMHFTTKKVFQPPDDSYHFGYHKYEPLTASVQSGLIIATCVISIFFAVQDIIHVDDTTSYSLPAIATFISGIIGICIVLHLKGEVRKTGSHMVKTASLHWIIDTALSFGVCVGFCFGLIMQKQGYTQITPYVDPVMSIILALFFVATPVRSGILYLFELLDAAPDENVRDRVNMIVERYKQKSSGIQRLRMRKAGRRIFVDICFFVKEDLTFKQAEALSQDFQRDIKTEFSNCDVVVSFESR